MANVSKIPNSLVTAVLERSTAYLNAVRVYIPWANWCPEPTSTIQPHWPRESLPAFPPSVPNPKGSNHQKQVLASVLIVLTQQGLHNATCKKTLLELVLQRTVVEEQREGNIIGNAQRRLETLL